MEAPGRMSLFKVSYKFVNAAAKEKGMSFFANMSKKQDDADNGDLIVLCRYHDIGEGTGFAIVAAKNESAAMDTQKWAVRCISRMRMRKSLF